MLGADQSSELIYQETLKATPAGTGSRQYTYEFTSTSDQTWFGFDRVNRDVTVTTNPNPLVLDNILVEDLTEEVVPTVDKSGLKALYNQYKDLDKSGYTSTTWKAFEKALKAAETVLKDEEASQDQVNAAKDSLQAAVDGLRVSKTTLEYFLNQAKAHVEAGDTEGLVGSVKQMFDEAVAEGEAVMAKEDASREEVKNAAMKLMLAIQALDMKAGDKTDLEMALELAGMIDLDQYAEAGQEAYLAAKEAAEAVLADKDAMQPEVDSAWQALTDAMAQLRLKADKAALEALLNSVAELDLEQYTEESVQTFKAAFASARAVLEDLSLTAEDQQTVDNAVLALSAAVDSLQPKEDVSGGEGENPGTDEGDGNEGTGSGTTDDGTGNGEGSSDTGNGSDGDKGTAGKTENAGNGNGSSDGGSQKAAKTGDAASAAGPAAAMMLAAVLAAGAVTIRRRQRR